MKTVLIFSGYNMRAIFAFLRTATKYQVPYKIIACSFNDAIFKTTYKHNVIATRETQDLEIDTFLELFRKVKLENPNQNFMVAPTTESLNRFFLKYRTEFTKINIDIPLCDESLYVSISDKSSFTQLCRKSGIDVPEEFDSITAAPLPCVAKPKYYKGKVSGKILNPIIIENEIELKTFLKEYESKDFFFQEYIPGGSYYLLYYFFKDNREPLTYSQENLAQQKSGGSILAAKSSDLHHTDLARKYKKLFQQIRFTGLVMVEVRGSPQEAKMIEANPRFWGPSQLFVDANVNFFSALLYDNGFDLPLDNHSREEITHYFWDDGESFETNALSTTAFHQYSPEQLTRDYRAWDNYNLLKRTDTIELYTKFMVDSNRGLDSKLAELRDLYNQASKHSNYQILPPLLDGLISNSELKTFSRFERERFEVIEKHIMLKDKRILDIGGNTGYFSFEALRKGARVSYWEGNQQHAKFVASAAALLGQESAITINNQYYLFDEVGAKRYDTVFLLNVLHHIGDDYGNTALSKEKAKESIVYSLRSISQVTNTVVLQLGFNWKGNRNLSLFQSGTKIEMIEFLKSELADLFEFEYIYVAEIFRDGVIYKPVNEANIERRDDLGEFLNRPILIMRTIDFAA